MLDNLGSVLSILDQTLAVTPRQRLLCAPGQGAHDRGRTHDAAAAAAARPGRIGLPERWRLRVQVGIASAAICVTLIGFVTAGAAWFAAGEAQRTLQASATARSGAIAHRLDLIMTRHYRQIQTIAALAPLRAAWTADPQQLRMTLDAIRASVPGYDWIGYAGADGAVRAASGSAPAPSQAGSQPWFRSGRFGVSATTWQLPGGGAGPGAAEASSPPAAPSPAFPPAASPPAASPPAVPAVVIAAPVRDAGGALLGVLAADLPADWADDLQERHDGAGSAPPLDVAVIAPDGQILAPPPFGAEPLGPQAVREAVRLGPGLHRLTGDGARALAAIEASHGTHEFSGAGWLVVLRIAGAQAQAAGRNAVLLCLAAGGCVAFLGAVLAFVFAGRLTSPIRRLCDEAERAAAAPTAILAPRAPHTAGWGNHETTAIARALRVLTRRNIDAEREMRRAAATAATVAARAAEEVTRLRRLVDLDPMTGTLNRRGLRKAVEAARAGVPCRSMGALVIDIDHFKHVNDAHGHLVGDAVIRRVAVTIGETVRHADIVARFGGEEFVVVVANANERELAVLGERIREAVRDTDAALGSLGGEAVAVTVSVGGAVAVGDSLDMEALLSRADAALYLAKNAGRNRVRMWRPGFARVRATPAPPPGPADLTATAVDAD